MTTGSIWPWWKEFWAQFLRGWFEKPGKTRKQTCHGRLEIWIYVGQMWWLWLLMPLKEAEVFLPWPSGLGRQLLSREIRQGELQTFTGKNSGYDNLVLFRSVIAFNFSIFPLLSPHPSPPPAVLVVRGGGAPPAVWPHRKHAGVRTFQTAAPGRRPQTPFFWKRGIWRSDQQQELGG